MPATQKEESQLTVFIKILGTDGVRFYEIRRRWPQQPCYVRKMCRGGVGIIVFFGGETIDCPRMHSRPNSKQIRVMESLEMVKEHLPKRPSSKYQPDSSTHFQVSPRVIDKEEAGEADRCVGRLLGRRSRDLLTESYPTGMLAQVA